MEEYSQEKAKGYLEINKKCLTRVKINTILNIVLEKPMLLVLAGAGYGKTEAISDYLNDIDAKIVWVQIENLDNISTKFWDNFIGVMFLKNSKIYKRFMTLGFPTNPASFDQFLHMFAKELAYSKKNIIVFDDFHLIEDEEIKKFVENIVIAKLMNLNIIVISRKTDTFSKMYLKGIAAKINEDDLRFSIEEVGQYFKVRGLKFTESELASIYDYTEGWAFVIYLLGLNLNRSDNFLEITIQKAKFDIFKLIEKEIYSICSPELQKVLIKISILEDIPVDLLRKIVKNNFYIIDEMEKSSLLIKYNQSLKTFKIHHIFREFLIEKQKLLEKNEIIEAQLQAASWYSDNQHIIEAINYYRKCNKYEEIFEIILNQKTRSTEETANIFIDVIDKAPKEFLEKAPIMYVVRAKYLLSNARVEEAQEQLVYMRSKYEKILDEDETNAREILGETYLVLALTNYTLKNYNFLELIKMADSYLPNASRIIDKTLELNLGNVVSFVKNPESGGFEKFIEAIFDVAPYATRVMNGCGFGMEYLSATKMSYNTGNFKSAEKNAYQAIYKAQQKEQNDMEIMSYFLLLRTSVARGDSYLSDNYFQVLKSQTKMQQSPNCLKTLDIAMSWFYVVIGQYSKVSDWIKNKNKEDEEKSLNEIFSPVCLGVDTLICARYYLAQNKYSEVLDIFKNEDNLYGADNFLLGTIEIEVLRSICYLHFGYNEKTLDSLEKAYELSVGNSLIMTFIEYGKQMMQLIMFAKQNEKCKIPKDWLNDIYEKSSSFAKHITHISSYSKTTTYNNEFENVWLTEQETQILTDICNGFSREEVSINNKIPINILKSIVKSIYDKLGVTNTVDAIFVATKMNLYKTTHQIS